MSDTLELRADRGDITLTDRVIGTVLLMAVAINVIAARSSAFILPIFFVMALASAFFERQSFRGFLKPVNTSLPLALWLLFAVLSSLWSADPTATATFTVMIFATFLQWHVVNHWLMLQSDRRIQHLSYWFVIAFAIGLAFLLHEVWANQYLRRLLVDNFGLFTPPTLNKHHIVDAAGRTHIRSFELNRSIATLNLLLWPALLCALAHWSGKRLALIASLFIGGVFLATVGSNHETSKIAILVGMACFIAAHFWRNIATAVIASAWALLVMGAVLGANFAHDHLELHTADWVQSSARERIVIWKDTAERVAEAPLIGVGARTAYVISNRMKEPKEHPSLTAPRERAAIHAHNMYLQNWFELGAVGAVLLLVAGLVALWGISHIPDRAQPFALATFAVFTIEIASSWELWQRWFAALFALTMIYLLLGIRSVEEPPPPDRHP
jgi:O-antigen ligase